MVIQFVYMALGPWSRMVIPWLADHSTWFALVFVVWGVLFWSGKVQLQRNEAYLQKATLDIARDWQHQSLEIEPNRLFETVYQNWTSQIHQLAWFIPNRLEIWVIPATVKNVQARTGFSPEWVKKVLVQHHFLSE